MADRLCARKAAVTLSAAAVAVLLAGAVAGASTLDDIGITSLRSLNSSLTGTGVSVGQVEATSYSGPSGQPYDPTFDANNFEWDPSVVIPGPPVPGVTWVGKVGTSPTTTFNPAQLSGHAQDVASIFLGTAGTSPGITAAVVFNANYFYNEVIDTNAALPLPLAPSGAAAPSVVNQSFIFDGVSAGTANFINQLYDNYVQAHGTIFVSGNGNGGGPQVPATAFNVIAVGAFGGASSVGPTSDGRSKPDITAPAGATSFSTPYVSGVATLLVQAGVAGLGGSSPATEAAAVDGRTIKALLLNGATKPAGWTHSTTQPLDLTYGAGIVNAYNSYQNLAAGKKTATAVNFSQTPLSGTSVGTEGWDFFTSLTSNSSNSGVAHYHVDLSAANGPSTFTSTLVWWRPAGTVTTDGSGHITSVNLATLNNLDLKLFNLATGQLVDPSSQSVSAVDSVEHIYLTNLAAGQYDLEVIKNITATTNAETYAMAFNLTGGAISLAVNGTVDLHGVSQNVGGITGAGTLTNSLAIPAVVTVVGTAQFDGVIQDGAGTVGLAKTSGGVLKLTGASTFSGGTTISGGTLLVSNLTGSATGGGAVVLNGGTLGGHGTISGAVTAGSGPHTIAPSTTLSANSTGALTLGALTTNANTTMAFNLVTPGASGSADRIAVSGSAGLTLNGGAIQVAHTSTGSSSLGYYRIIQYNGGFNGSTSGLTLPPTANNVAYLLDMQRDPGFIDLHRGFLGDANDDGLVNFADFVLLSNNFDVVGAGWSGGDFNGDGITNFADFVTLSNNFGGVIGASLAAGVQTAASSGLGAAISGVPEPASLVLLGAGLLVLLRRHRAA